MGIILGLLGLITIIALFRKVLRNSSEVLSGEKVIKALKENPAKAHEMIAGLSHKCWYVNMDQLPEWDRLIRYMPETFRLGGFADVNHWQIHNENEVLMIVVCEYQEMGVAGSAGRSSLIKGKMHLTIHLRPNPKSGDYEMRVRMPQDRDEKSAMSAFGRKFFDALKERQATSVYRS